AASWRALRERGSRERRRSRRCGATRKRHRSGQDVAFHFAEGVRTSDRETRACGMLFHPPCHRRPFEPPLALVDGEPQLCSQSDSANALTCRNSTKLYLVRPLLMSAPDEKIFRGSA